ncbi:bromodomain-containing protein homolog [Chironomus tepperi]|uniref:bromodomain-containing protein homolog n=1 Tax=Chironomus tepperi TaxID=113505 RepID=UPI00391F68CB
MIDFDIPEYLKSIKGQGPPYKCPACEKQYKSTIGLQYHLKNHDRDPSTPATPATPTAKKRKKGKNTPKIKSNNKNKSPSTPIENQIIFDDAQNLILKVKGKTIPLPIDEDIPLIDMQVYEKMTAHSNYEIEDIEPPKEPIISLPEAIYRPVNDYVIVDAPPKPTGYIRFIEKTPEELDGEIEYDVDEEDTTWLDMINDKRSETNLNVIPVETLELLIDRLEKESYFQAASNGQAVSIIDEDAICCICMDGECQNTNVILFCDMCNLAVHQDCYGVPYIPENQWLCRQCLQSPSKPVQCKLCPNSGGAFKQTDTSEWAHVVCALWIPEVRFANTVFLEPIDSIDCIPPARWRLVCYICKQKTGACIQCNKNYCYSAFHVTCAQYAGLCMRMETVKSNDGQMMVQKMAFCDQHTPSNYGSEKSPIENEKAREECRNKMKLARKMLAKKRSSAPIILIPTIPTERVQEISNLVNFKKKDQFMQRLIAYWTLKRQFRNGVPLLRRLQTSTTSSHSRGGLEGSPDAKELYKQLKYWQHLRQDLERARLLCELVRKREKLKMVLIKITEECVMTEIDPLGTAMHKIIDQLVQRDSLEIFLEPVDVTEVPDYANVIKNPMDLGTMREKLKTGGYDGLDDMEADFSLMIRNCLLYNNKETIFYKMGVKMKEQGSSIFKQARKELERSGLIEAPIADGELVKIIDKEMKEIVTKPASVEGIKKLEQLQSKANSIKHHLAKAKKMKIIKMEVIKMKKLLNRGRKSAASTESEESQSDGESSGSDDKDKDELKTPTMSPLKSSALSTTTSPLSSGVNRRNAVLFTRKQQVLKRPELPDLSSMMKSDSLLGSLSSRLDELKPKQDEKKRGRGRKLGWRKHPAAASNSLECTPSTSRNAIDSTPKSMLLTPTILPNTSITLETPKFDARIPDSFRLYRGQGSNSENSEQSEFSDSCTSCEFSESYTNSEYGSSGSENASDSEIGSDNNSDSGSFNQPENADEDSQGTATTTTRTSADKKDEESRLSESDDETEPVASTSSGAMRAYANAQSGKLKPLQLVWAKSRGYPWYPALIIDPSIPKGFVHNSVPLPCPPDNVLTLRKNQTSDDFLVLFFDTKRTWQWLPSSKLELLGIHKSIDESKLSESKKPTLRKAVKKAYEEALHYQSQVTKKKPEGKL